MPNLLCHQSTVWPCIFILDVQNQQPKDSLPLRFAIGRTCKNDAEAKGQQDELGYGLNLVNYGMYLDVNNADVSQSIIW